MTREQALAEARIAAARAKELAQRADNTATYSDTAQVTRYAAAGSLWADTSRAYTALAAALPETETIHG
uniref:Uncharacterized protein n=1 Tax=Streptomyces sp. NBC_00093 TaxID=2975649 RepID=A0AAU2A2E8_9ACTN